MIGGMRWAITAGLDVLLVVWVLAAGPLCWLLRDGLGPGAEDSHGLDAVFRFWMTYWWGPVLTVLVLLRLTAWRWTNPAPNHPNADD
jgi:hypothetical protein